LPFTLLAQIATKGVKINWHTTLPLGDKGFKLLPHISGNIAPRSERNDTLKLNPGLVFPPLFQEHLPETKVGINIRRPKADGLTKCPDGFSTSAQAGVGNTEIMVHLRQVGLIVNGLPEVFGGLG